MPVVAALLDSRPALLILRRTLAPDTRVVSCRAPRALEQRLQSQLLDAVLLGRQALSGLDLTDLRARFPGIPLLGFAPFKPDQGAGLLAHLEAGRIAAVIVEGVDDAVAGDLVRRHAASRARESALGEAPRLLRLSEPIQRDAWRLVIMATGHPITTAEVAARLGVTREHLSRQFGAGGAPNLKRVIDLLRVVYAAQLLGNPAYDTAAVARLLRFASPSHLSAMARRICGEPASRLAAVGARGILGGFLRGGMRSRS